MEKANLIYDDAMARIEEQRDLVEKEIKTTQGEFDKVEELVKSKGEAEQIKVKGEVEELKGEIARKESANTFAQKNITQNLQKIENVRVIDRLATWDKIDNATDYDVFINGIKVANTAATSLCVADYIGKSGNYSIEIVPKHGENPYYSTDIPSPFAFEHTEYADFGGYPVYFALYDTITVSFETCADNYRYVVTYGDNCVFEKETADNFTSLPQEENNKQASR